MLFYLIMSTFLHVKDWAPFVVTLTSLSSGNSNLSKALVTFSNKSCPVLVSFKCSVDSNSSLAINLSSTLRIKIRNCALSYVSVLSSRAMENNLNVFF